MAFTCLLRCQVQLRGAHSPRQFHGTNLNEQAATLSSNFLVPSCPSRRAPRSTGIRLQICSAGNLKPTRRAGVSAAVFSPENAIRTRHGAQDKFTSWKILVVMRGNEPYKGCWSLPGGNLLEGEGVLEGAKRELKEETGLFLPTLQGPFASHNVSELLTIQVCAGVCESRPAILANDDAQRALFVPLKRLSQLDTTPGLAEIVHRVAPHVLPASYS
jgi:8-oxo-dGTP diphosphatase